MADDGFVPDYDNLFPLKTEDLIDIHITETNLRVTIGENSQFETSGLKRRVS